MRVPMRHARGTYYCILLALDFALHLNISTNDKHINPVPLMRSYNRCRFEEVSIKGAWCLLFTTLGATMGDYGWSMDSDTPQGIDAVEYGRVLEYPKRRNCESATERDY